MVTAWVGDHHILGSSFLFVFSVVFLLSTSNVLLNPFSTTICNVSGLKVNGKSLQTVYFLLALCITSTFNAMRFDENPLTCQRENRRRKRLKGFEFRILIGRFSNDTMVVKGLNTLNTPPAPTMTVNNRKTIDMR